MAGFDFSSFFNKNSSGIFGSFNFSDYAAIKSGSYKKLMKSYYAQNKVSEVSSSGKKDKTEIKNKVNVTDTTGLSKMKQEADDLRTTAKTLADDDLWKKNNGNYDMDKVTSAIKSFASDYNDVISQGTKVSAKDVTQQIGFMTSLSKTMSGSLSKIGITFAEDGKMSVDEEKLKKADGKDVKAMFSGSYSYAAQIEVKASAVSSAALRSSSMYSSNGMLSNSMMGNYNQWI